MANSSDETDCALEFWDAVASHAHERLAPGRAFAAQREHFTAVHRFWSGRAVAGGARGPGRTNQSELARGPAKARRLEDTDRHPSPVSASQRAGNASGRAAFQPNRRRFETPTRPC